jgi:hypothetical protein
MKQKITLLALLISSMVMMSAQADSNIYGNSPITVKNYTGDKKTSNSYKGQIARHLLNNSLKKLAGQGNGKPNAELKAKMLSYYAGKEAGRIIIDPQTKGEFKIKQNLIDDLAKGKNLKEKTFKGAVPSWPGRMSAPEVAKFMIDKASSTNKGFDPLTGYNYPQLLSKFLMGAVFYNQAVDNYLDEKLEAGTKPNNKAYKEGAAYTGKEHVWDEAFGYFGAPAHAMTLTSAEAKGIGKLKNIKIADANGDGVVDLYKEMIYSHSAYAADADKAGTNYLHTITKAYIDGRSLITSAKGNALTDAQRATLKGYATTIKITWQIVIAEAAFKYAGETYEDLQTLKAVVSSNGDAKKPFAAYGKHWSEMKGFVMALQTSGKDLGDVAVKLNRLIGFGPALLGGNQVSGINAKGNLVTGGNKTMGDYMLNMIKVQSLLSDAFSLKAKQHDMTNKMDDLLNSLGQSKSAEND